MSLGRSSRLWAALFLLSSAPLSHAATELFLSEYVEGSSNNKAVEIVNETGASVNLAGGVYDIQLAFNGGAPTTTIALTGTVASADVYVLANSSAAAAILGAADPIGTELVTGARRCVAAV